MLHHYASCSRRSAQQQAPRAARSAATLSRLRVGSSRQSLAAFILWARCRINLMRDPWRCGHAQLRAQFGWGLVRRVAGSSGCPRHFLGCTCTGSASREHVACLPIHGITWAPAPVLHCRTRAAAAAAITGADVTACHHGQPALRRQAGSRAGAVRGQPVQLPVGRGDAAARGFLCGRQDCAGHARGHTGLAWPRLLCHSRWDGVDGGGCTLCSIRRAHGCSLLAVCWCITHSQGAAHASRRTCRVEAPTSNSRRNASTTSLAS